MTDQLHQAVHLLPMPVTLIGAKDGDQHNITTAAWINQISWNPLQLMVSISPQRYIHDMIARTGEFMVTIMGEGDRATAFFCGTRSGRNTDKLKELNLPTEPGEVIAVPRIKDALANLECKLVKSIVSGNHTLFIGEVAAADYKKGPRPLVLWQGELITI
ncbi:MAG: flavin reductase family protein [Thermacetogeniaceae bacterium]|jgi:flavin reductase (DIM6/NTAB) family NADH-FMN oxidoreductase RutF|nr:flavin reductase family protein [Thermoanaerobacterales bacterium]